MTSLAVRARLPLLAVLTLLLAGGASAKTPAARKPEDVFKGRVILSPKPFPASFASDGAFVQYMRGADTKAFKFGEGGKIPVEFMAFFAAPVSATQLQATIYDITERRELKDTFPIYPGQRGTRILASFVELVEGTFESERRYHLVITPGYRGAVLAETTFVIKR